MSQHAPVDGVPVPFAGNRPGATIRYSKGEAVVGVIHATDETFTMHEPTWSAVTARCGRKVRPLTVYNPDTWGRLALRPVGTCRGCAAVDAEARNIDTVAHALAGLYEVPAYNLAGAPLGRCACGTVVYGDVCSDCRNQ